MSTITTHVLDTARGMPGDGIKVRLETLDGVLVGSGETNADGRIPDLLKPGILKSGSYKMVFETGAYLKKRHGKGFYPFVPVVFEIEDSLRHYHIPLLISPYGYSTYRGS
jgi:5-hydroxyisourate hydrolase